MPVDVVGKSSDIEPFEIAGNLHNANTHDIGRDQHQHLVECLNELYKAQEGGDRQQVAQVLEELIVYTADHFAYEERLLEEAGYRLVAQHKKVHQNFVNKVLYYQALKTIIGENTLSMV